MLKFVEFYFSYNYFFWQESSQPVNFFRLPTPPKKTGPNSWLQSPVSNNWQTQSMATIPHNYSSQANRLTSLSYKNLTMSNSYLTHWFLSTNQTKSKDRRVGSRSIFLRLRLLNFFSDYQLHQKRCQLLRLKSPEYNNKQTQSTTTISNTFHHRQTDLQVYPIRT